MQSLLHPVSAVEVIKMELSVCLCVLSVSLWALSQNMRTSTNRFGTLEVQQHFKVFFMTIMSISDSIWVIPFARNSTEEKLPVQKSLHVNPASIVPEDVAYISVLYCCVPGKQGLH